MHVNKHRRAGEGHNDERGCGVRAWLSALAPYAAPCALIVTTLIQIKAGSLPPADRYGAAIKRA